MVRTALCIILLLLVTLPAAAQTQPTPTPDPEILRLQLEVEALKAQMPVYQQAAEHEALGRIGGILVIVAGAVVIAAAAGAALVQNDLSKRLSERVDASLKSLEQETDHKLSEQEIEVNKRLKSAIDNVEQFIRERFDTAIYRVDPLYFPVHIPAEGFETERKRLEYLGFAALRPYTSLSDRLRQGIVVFLPAADDPTPDIETLIAFMQDERQPADPEKVGFVIYHTRIPPETVKRLFDAFPGSVTIANNAVTVASAIYAVARGLKYYQPSGHDAIT